MNDRNSFLEDPLQFDLTNFEHRLVSYFPDSSCVSHRHLELTYSGHEARGFRQVLLDDKLED